MHTQKTQVLTNGISDICDNRRDILKHYNDKLNENKKAKEAMKKQLQLRQLNKGKKPDKKYQAHTTTVKAKRKNTKKDAPKKHDKTQIGTNCSDHKESEITANNTKRDPPQKSKVATGDNLDLRDGTSIRILSPNEQVKYLGNQLNLINHTDKDIDERIRKGWIKFS